MTWAYVLRPREVATYRRCRRAWDLGARIRQNYVPAIPPRLFDFERAIHDALAVYYFPAMDDWDRSIVRPLAIKGFHRAMQEDLARYQAVAPITPEQEADWDRASELGNTMLNGYFDWAGPLDTFASIFSDQEYWAPIPNPAQPGSELVNQHGREIRYLGRVDQLFSDHNDEYWIAQHRLVGNHWEEDDQLLLDIDGLTDLWATELTYPQLRIAGIVYNELRMDLEVSPHSHVEGFDARLGQLDGRTMRRPRHIHTRRSPMTPTDASAAAMTLAQQAGDPGDFISARTTGEWFRRTHVRRGRATLRAIGLMVAAEAAEMANPQLAVYPTPSPDNCQACVFQAPCLAMSEGSASAGLLEASFRRRTEEEGEEERLRWSIGRAQTRASMSSDGSKPGTVNFHWG